MAILLVADHDNASLSDQTAKALTAASQIGGDVHILVAGKDARAAADAASRAATWRKTTPTITKGSIVRPKNNATLSLASPGSAKNKVPAREMATAASPAALKACNSINRKSPDSRAPSAPVARRVASIPALVAPVTPRPIALSPLPTAWPLRRAALGDCGGAGMEMDSVSVPSSSGGESLFIAGYILPSGPWIRTRRHR